MNYVPIGGRVCILPEKRKEKTEGIKAGDKVIYNLGRVFPLEQEGILYHVVNYEEVYAVLPQ